MASAEEVALNQWEVYLSNEKESEVKVTVNMPLATAEAIVRNETRRLADLNPGRDNVSEPSIGSAVMMTLSRFAAETGT